MKSKKKKNKDDALKKEKDPVNSSHDEHHSYRHKAAHFASRTGGLFSAIDYDSAKLVLVTVISLIIVVLLVAVAILYNNSILKKYDEEAQIASENGSTVKIDEIISSHEKSGDSFSITEENLHPGRVFPPSDVFDEDGKCLIDVVYGANGAFSGAIYHTYVNGKPEYDVEYSAIGDLVSITDNTPENPDAVKMVSTVVYDNKYNYDGYEESDYDKNGIVIKKTKYAHTGVLDSYSTFTYNEKKQVSRETLYSTYETVIGYIDYSYDAHGNVTRKEQYDQNGSLGLTDEFEYDDLDRLVKEQNLVKGVCRTYTTYVYDESGNCEKHAFYLANETEMKYEEYKDD